MHRVKCMRNIRVRYRNNAQWILVRNAEVVRASYWHDEEEMLISKEQNVMTQSGIIEPFVIMLISIS
jgi:hypothetical protein